MNAFFCVCRPPRQECSFRRILGEIFEIRCRISQSVFRSSRTLSGFLQTTGTFLAMHFFPALPADSWRQGCSDFRSDFFGIGERADRKAERFSGKDSGPEIFLRILFGLGKSCKEGFRGKRAFVINPRGNTAKGKLFDDSVPIFAADGVLGAYARVFRADLRNLEAGHGRKKRVVNFAIPFPSGKLLF